LVTVIYHLINHQIMFFRRSDFVLYLHKYVLYFIEEGVKSIGPDATFSLRCSHLCTCGTDPQSSLGNALTQPYVCRSGRLTSSLSLGRLLVFRQSTSSDLTILQCPSTLPSIEFAMPRIPPVPFFWGQLVIRSTALLISLTTIIIAIYVSVSHIHGTYYLVFISVSLLRL